MINTRAYNRTRAWMVGAVAGAAMVLSVVPIGNAFAFPAPMMERADDDVIVLLNGKEFKGTIIEENATVVKFRLAGIPSVIEYQRSQIKEIRRGGKGGDAPEPVTTDKSDAKAEAPAADIPGVADGTDAAQPTTDSSAGGPVIPVDGRTRYYYTELTGELGEDITETPIMDALKDARLQKADVVIFYLDAKWQLPNDDKAGSDDLASFDQIFRAEEIVPNMLNDLEQKWDKPPKLVYWVKTAMGGAALLPIVSPNIYMHSDGRIGGLGNLSTIFEGTGDEIVREKQRSLRLGHAEGWMIKGGYDPRIMRAMSRIEYILSARINGDSVELFEGYPQNPSDELLTDDGEKDRMDTLTQRVAGEGNDVLTMHARTAKLLGVSKGTVDSRDDLFNALGLDHNAVDVSNKSGKIMTGWKDQLGRAKKQLKDMLRDYSEVRVQPPGEYKERTAARGKRLQLLRQMRTTINRYKEALTPPFFGRNGFPARTPNDMDQWITVQEEAIKLAQMQDKK